MAFITNFKLKLFYLFIVNDFTQPTLWESVDETLNQSL